LIIKSFNPVFLINNLNNAKWKIVKWMLIMEAQSQIGDIRWKMVKKLIKANPNLR